MNKSYEKGRRFEYKVKQWLEERGWLCFRTAGSHSPFDIIGMKEGETIGIQCKYNVKITRGEMKNLIMLKNDIDPFGDGLISFFVAEGAARQPTKFAKVPWSIQIHDVRAGGVKDDWFGTK